MDILKESTYSNLIFEVVGNGKSQPLYHLFMGGNMEYE